MIEVTGLKPRVGKTASSALEKDMAHRKDHRTKQSGRKKKKLVIHYGILSFLYQLHVSILLCKIRVKIWEFFEGKLFKMSCFVNAISLDNK